MYSYIREKKEELTHSYKTFLTQYTSLPRKSDISYRASLRTMCACRDWCSLVHKTTYKQQDERRRTHSVAYEARCILIGLCTMQERMFRCTESIYYRVTQLGLGLGYRVLYYAHNI